MTEQQERIQDLLDDFIMRNEAPLETASQENPLLAKSVLDVIEVLSRKYGTGKTSPIEQKLEEKVEENIEEVQEQSEEVTPALFKEGDYFYHKDDKSTLYQIGEVTPTSVDVILPRNGGTVVYPFEEVNLNFANEVYVNLGSFDEVEMSKKAPKVETVVEIKKEEEEETLTLEDLKQAVKNLKPLADFDESVKEEIERLKKQIAQLKKKKS